ncbi:MAG: hypothetical protein H6658_00105 [Ardenticatenaceae bacterium]|nr:hypothetical protein [Ardenticatenaceae bacterium]
MSSLSRLARFIYNGRIPANFLYDTVVLYRQLGDEDGDGGDTAVFLGRGLSLNAHVALSIVVYHILHR